MTSPRTTAPYSPVGYCEHEDRAYHRVNGLPFRKRTKPPYLATGWHPSSPYKKYPIIARKFTTLRGQLHAWHIREWQESQGANDD